MKCSIASFPNFNHSINLLYYCLNLVMATIINWLILRNGLVLHTFDLCTIKLGDKMQFQSIFI